MQDQSPGHYVKELTAEPGILGEILGHLLYPFDAWLTNNTELIHLNCVATIDETRDSILVGAYQFQ